jgi:hypothetical protein
MKTMRMIVVAVVLVAAASFGITRAAKPVPAPAPAPSLKEQMIGTWRLQSRVTRHPDGTEIDDPAYGPNPGGYISYDRAGFMSVQFMKRDRPKDVGTAGYNAYFGPYTVDEAAKTVTHHVEGNLNPAGVGQNNVREVNIEGDKLTLTIRNANSPNIAVNTFIKIK